MELMDAGKLPTDSKKALVLNSFIEVKEPVTDTVSDEGCQVLRLGLKF